MSRDNPDQIPTEYTEEQTMRAVRKQSQVPGEGRDKTISDFAKAAAMGQVLKEMEFPANKHRIIQFMEQSNMPESRELLPVVQKIEEKQYENVSEVTMAAGLVSE